MMRRRGVKSKDEEQRERLRILTESDLERHFFEENVEGIKHDSSKRKIAIGRFFPVTKWIPSYPRSKFVRDFTLGLTLAFVIAPKAMAHALLANVKPEHGIYTALSASFAYGMMGTCALLSVGTCALPALLFGEALIASNLEDYETGISTLTFMTGVITLIMAIFRLERLTSFIPPCALSAFTTTAAFLIGTSQVKYMLGLHFKADGFVQTWIAVFRNIQHVNIPTLLISLIGVLFLKFCKKAVRKWGGSMPDPSAIVLVLSTTLISSLCDLENSGVDVVGKAPTGIVVSAPNLNLVPRFISSAITIAVINYVLATSIAKSMASKSEAAQFDSAQELRALSGVNLIGSFFGAFVAGGSFSGSAIISSMNGDSMMHNFVNAAAMFVVIMVLLPLLASLPKAVLGCIIISALERLVDLSVVPTLWRVKFDDFIIWLVTFLATLFGGVQYGMMVAISASLLALVRRVSKASTVVELGRLRGTSIYRRFDMFPDSRRLMCRHEQERTFYPLRIYRVDSSIHFGNTEQIEDDLLRALQQIKLVNLIEMSSERSSESSFEEDLKQRDTKETEEKVQDEEDEDVVRGVILLSCVGVNFVDTAAISMLRRFAESCEKENVRLYFTGWKANCRATLYRYAREIELRERAGTTTPANAPELAINRLTNSKGGAATIPVRNIERKKNTSSPLNPNRWFLSLHDAVLRMNAVEMISSRRDAGDRGGSRSVGKSHAWRFTGHIARAFVRESGNLVGRTPREVDFRNKYDSVIIRIFRDGNALPVSRIGRVVLRADDELVLDINNSFDRDGKNTRRDLRVELTQDMGGKLSLNTAVNMLIAAHVESIERTTRTIVNQTVEDAGLRGLPGLFLVAIERIDRKILHAVSPKEIIRSGDVLWFAIISKDNSSAARVKAADILNGIVGLRMSEQKHRDVSNEIFDRVRKSAPAEIDPITRKEVREHSIMVNLK